MFDVFLAFGLAYLLGSFPSAYLVARAKGQNIFTVGSGNMGAMNTARNLSWGWGAVVLLTDIIKGSLATWLALQIGGSNMLPAFAASFAVVLGHCYSIFINFKGGKGLATALGASIAIYPWLGIAGLTGIILLSLGIKGRSNLAASVLAVSYPVLAAIFLTQRGWSGSAFIWAMVSIVLYSSVILIKYLPDVRSELLPQAD